MDTTEVTGMQAAPAAASLPQTLASDAEREQAVETLRRACVEGRLTLVEFSERLERALTARTQAAIAELTADVVAAPVVGRARAATHRVMALMSSATQKGQWRAQQHIDALAVMGECTLDLRLAAITGAELDIRATSIMGQVTVIVPRGVEVELDGWAVMGSREFAAEPDEPLLDRARKLQVAAPSLEPAPVGPLVRIYTRVVMGSITVEHRD